MHQEIIQRIVFLPRVEAVVLRVRLDFLGERADIGIEREEIDGAVVRVFADEILFLRGVFLGRNPVKAFPLIRLGMARREIEERIEPFPTRQGRV